jgi:Ni/Co efflux regulator RcnB
MKKLFVILFSCSMLISYSVGWAASDEEEMEAMQKQLNKQVMEQPFHAEEPEKVDAYVKEAMKKHLKPPKYTGDHWRRGYTCHDMLRYSWYEYRNCMYYYRYYGYYYPYP